MRSPMTTSGPGARLARHCGGSPSSRLGSRSAPATASGRRFRGLAPLSPTTKRCTPGSPRCRGPASVRAWRVRTGSSPPRPMWRLRSGAFTATADPARCRSGRRRSPGSTRSRARGGGEFELGYLDCVAEAAQRGARELARLQEAARKIAALPELALPSASSRRPAPGSISPLGWSRPACCAR
jgi:hypothetical protein